MTIPDPRRVTTFRPGWLKRRVATSVALLDSLPPKLRASLAQPSRRRRPAREFPADPPTRPPVMAEGATWPSGTVAPFPAAWFNTVAAAIVGAIPPDDACIADEDECFERHPIHLGWSVDGTARTVYAKVDGLIEIVLAAVAPLIRAQWEAEQPGYEPFVAAGPDENASANPLWQWAAGAWSPITPAVPGTFAAPVTYREDSSEPDEPVADVQAAFDGGEKGITKRPLSNREFIAAEVQRLGLQPKVDAWWAEIENAPPPPPGWCLWHQTHVAECPGDAPECREARTEIAGGGDRG